MWLRALALLVAISVAAAVAVGDSQQRPLGGGIGGESSGAASESDVVAAPSSSVPLQLFASLERFARLVDIAYCVGTTGTGIAPPFKCVSRCRDFPEMRLVTTWNTGVLLRDSCGYIAVDDSTREVVVAFRGTYSIANTVVDLSTIPQEYVPYEPGDDNNDGSGDDNSTDTDRPQCHNCTAHSGFLASWRSTRKLVLPAVAAARRPPAANASSSSSASSDPPYRVHLVGHSLGGAVAALAALEMKVVLGWKDVRVTTFGEPRVGNGALATFIEAAFDMASGEEYPGPSSSYRRVTHKNDPVPLLPLAEWGYQEHAGEVYISKGNLPPAPADVRLCQGRSDPACIAGSGSGDGGDGGSFFPPGLRLWELFFAHRDYFWRLGLCVPGGDPADWGRERYNYTDSEL